MGDEFPAATGQRRQWAEVPADVRVAVEDALGSPVVSAASQAGGFSPGVAARLECADGSRAFVKAVSKEPNRMSPMLHRREARISAALPAGAPVPALRFTYDDGDWVVLVFDEIAGREPRLPWQADELRRVLTAVDELARALTPSPIAVETIAETFATVFSGWRGLSDDPASVASLPPGWADRVEECAGLEEQWADATRGDSLAHLDHRADNLLLTEDRVFVVDWPWASLAAPWVSLAAMLPSVAMQGGPDVETVWRDHPLSRGVDDEQLDVFLAAVAGMLTRQSLLPPSPGLPTLRAFQAGQAEHARAWLAQRRGW